MQDSYVGDIGDYGKYGLLREVTAAGLSLAVNWYTVVPVQESKQDDGKDKAAPVQEKAGKQADGRYTDYLSAPHLYRAYDPVLFDALHQIVCIDKSRRIQSVENAHLFPASFFSNPLGADRSLWHREALEQTKGAEVVFLDPDNGLETRTMNRANSATEKHVKWPELQDYYTRGQNVILYQHRPQMTKKEQCIENILAFQREYLKAGHLLLLEFPKYTNRFYFMFLHKEYLPAFQKVCAAMAYKWGKNNFCREIPLA